MISSVVVGLAPYLITIIAWDLERFFFCSYMSVFLLTVFTVKRFMHEVKVSMEILTVILIVPVSYMGMSKNRFGLFDDVTYIENFSSLIEKIEGRFIND